MLAEMPVNLWRYYALFLVFINMKPHSCHPFSSCLTFYHLGIIIWASCFFVNHSCVFLNKSVTGKSKTGSLHKISIKKSAWPFQVSADFPQICCTDSRSIKVHGIKILPETMSCFVSRSPPSILSSRSFADIVPISLSGSAIVANPGIKNFAIS